VIRFAQRIRPQPLEVKKTTQAYQLIAAFNYDVDHKWSGGQIVIVFQEMGPEALDTMHPGTEDEYESYINIPELNRAEVLVGWDEILAKGQEYLERLISWIRSGRELRVSTKEVLTKLFVPAYATREMIDSWTSDEAYNFVAQWITEW